MNKQVILGIAAFGGIVLLVAVLPRGEIVNEEPLATDAVVVLPADLPAFPMYQPSVLTGVQETDSESVRDISISLTAQAERTEIYDWYREQLSTGGWSITSDRNVAGYQIIQGEKDNLYTSLQVASGEMAEEHVISQQMKVRVQ